MTISIKTFAKSITSGCAVAALITSSAAMAQSTDSATARAAASLQIETPPLTVEAESDLQFGTVNIPNGAIAGNRCVYGISSTSRTSFIFSEEIDPSGAIAGTVAPTPSGCGYSGSFSTAQFALTCTVGTPTNVSLTVNSLLSESGAVLTPDPGVQMTALASGTSASALVFGTSDTMVVTCPEGASAGDLISAFDVVVGGRLTLSELATPGSDITVGTITLTASY